MHMQNTCCSRSESHPTLVTSLEDSIFKQLKSLSCTPGRSVPYTLTVPPLVFGALKATTQCPTLPISKSKDQPHLVFGVARAQALPWGSALPPQGVQNWEDRKARLFVLLPADNSALQHIRLEERTYSQFNLWNQEMRL